MATETSLGTISMARAPQGQSGPRGTDVVRFFAHAETNPAALAPALAALDHLPATDRRNVLASFAALHRTAA